MGAGPRGPGDLSPGLGGVRLVKPELGEGSWREFRAKWVNESRVGDISEHVVTWTITLVLNWGELGATDRLGV